MHISQLSTIAHAIMGVGTEQAKLEAISPRNLLEYIINLFTFGTLRQARHKQYDAIVKTLAEKLNENLQNEPAKPPRWGMDGSSLSIPLGGCNVTFFVPKTVGEISIQVETRSGNKREYAYADRERFFRVCTLLLLGDRYPVKDIPLTLSENGCIDLQGVNLSFADLRGIDLQGACLDNVNFAHANLRDANLSKASLQGADLNYAKLDDANLEGADFCSAKRRYLPDNSMLYERR